MKSKQIKPLWNEKNKDLVDQQVHPKAPAQKPEILPEAHLSQLVLPSHQQSSSGTEEGTGTQDGATANKTATMSINNLQKSTTGKSTSSSGINNKEDGGHYMTIKDVPVDLKNLNMHGRRQSKDTNCSRLSQKVYPGD